MMLNHYIAMLMPQCTKQKSMGVIATVFFLQILSSLHVGAIYLNSTCAVHWMLGFLRFFIKPK